MADYKHIFYSDVASIANPSTNNALFGASNGPGFGWHDINVYNLAWIGATVPYGRSGLAILITTARLMHADIMMNILAPAMVQHHFTGGFKYQWSDSIDVEFSAMYAPDGSLKGTDAYGATSAAQPIEISMHEIETMMGITYHWNGRQELEPLK